MEREGGVGAALSGRGDAGARILALQEGTGAREGTVCCGGGGMGQALVKVGDGWREGVVQRSWLRGTKRHSGGAEDTRRWRPRACLGRVGWQG